MAINTLITLKDALTTFVEQHEQLQRIEFEADDHRAPKITDGDEFPMLFVAPISVQMGNAMNMHTIRIYVYERINDDRSDVWENANDTSLMLRDIKVWWNSYSDSDIMITGEPSGEFKCDAELDNVVGYYSDFIFEIPSHGRCDVPINVVPDPSPTCADASYIVQYVDGTLIEAGTIPSGGSRTIDVPLCDGATWELRNSEGTLLDSGTIASGGSATITAPDATYQIRKSNNAMLYQGNIVSGGSLVQNISDSTVRVRKSNNQVIQEVDVRAESVENYDVADSVAVLKNTEGTTLSTTNILATESEDITAPNGTAENSDGTFTLAVPSGTTQPIPDSQLNVNSVDVGDVVSVKTIDVNLVDEDAATIAPLSTDLTGNTATIEVLNWNSLAADMFEGRVLSEGGTFEAKSCLADELTAIGDFTQPSLILTPNGYGTGVLNTFKPFDGTGDFSVVRATTATRVNSAGLIESVAANVPRVNYPIGGGCPSILVEPQRSNLLVNSVFENNGTNITSFLRIITNTPIYSFSIENIGESLDVSGVSGDRLHFRQDVSVVNTSIYTISCNVKVLSGNPIIRDIIFPTGILIDETRINGVVTPETDTLSVGSYLIEMNVTANSTSLTTRFGLGAALTLAYSAEVSITLPQIELGAEATSRIPTTGVTATRNADVIDVTTPAGVTEIVETFADGSTNTITSIPATYQLPNGEISKVVMT